MLLAHNNRYFYNYFRQTRQKFTAKLGKKNKNACIIQKKNVILQPILKLNKI